MKKYSGLIIAFSVFVFSVFLVKSPFLSSLTPSSPPAMTELEKPEYVAFINSQSGSFQDPFAEGIFHGQRFAPPSREFAEKNLEEPTDVLSEATGEEKWIEVDLSQQRLYAHEGDKIVYNFLVSTGKWAPTPTGNFRIWIKLRYATMKGGNKDDNTYYYLPNVPYVMYFYKGYGLHGTYWHNNFGQPMSHGCVNLSIPDAESIFLWVHPKLKDGQTVTRPTADDPGTRVVIHE